MAKDKPTIKDDGPQPKKIPLRYVNPESRRQEYTNHVIVGQDEDSYYLTFYNAPPPLLLGTKEQIAKQMEAIEFLDAACVSKLVMPKSLASELHRVLAAQFAKSTEPSEPKMIATNDPDVV